MIKMITQKVKIYQMNQAKGLGQPGYLWQRIYAQ